MLKLDLDLSTDILCELWAACGRCGTLPQAWVKTILVSLHKKGEHNDPNNYRPISLLSRTRKIVESAIDIMLKKLYSKSPLQLGFQPGKSMGNCNSLSDRTTTSTAAVHRSARLDRGIRHGAEETSHRSGEEGPPPVPF